MDRILVTGATGKMSRQTLEQLLHFVPAQQLIGLAREPARANDLVAEGIEIRRGDYLDYRSLLDAFEGVDKLMLVSAHGFTDRFAQHYNAITAARQVGVRHVVYTAIMRKDGSGLVLPEVTESDIFTEQTLRASGLHRTIMYHPPFYEVMPGYFGQYPDEGVVVTEGSGKVAPATREELAAANVAVLTQRGHEGKSYTLAGNDAASFAEIAELLSRIKGAPVPYAPTTREELAARLLTNGAPTANVEFLLGWLLAISTSEFEEQSGDLERLIGRPSTTFLEFLSR